MRIALVIDNDNHQNKASRIFELFIITLVSLNAIELILESFKSLREQFGSFFYYFELVSVIIFTIEYLLRIWIADLSHPTGSYPKSLLKFLGSWSGLIDLMAVLPFYLPLVMDLRFVRILRIMRLLRLLKLTRYSKSLSIIGKVIHETRQELNITLFITCILLFFASTIMYYLENAVQPEVFPNIPATLWWAVATLTTVGYGDVYPITPLGKLLSGVIALLGIGIVALPTGIISAAFLTRLEKFKKEDKIVEKSENKEDVFKCPHCGEDIDNHLLSDHISSQDK